MSDYNDELLPEPCLRMDTHFGDEYESVEFGDGTGFIKAVPTLARFGALNAGLDKLRDENAKLRELTKHLYECTRHSLCAACEYAGDACDFEYDLDELGIEVNV